MFSQRLEQIISQTVESGIRRLSHNKIRPFFGLQAGLVLYDALIEQENMSFGEQAHKVGKAAVACAIIKDRDSQEYFSLKRQVKMMRDATRRGETVPQEQVEHVLVRAQDAEERTRKDRLKKLIKKYNLEQTSICGLRLFLPDTKQYIDMINSEEEEEKDCFIESFSWRPLADWCEFTENAMYYRREQSIKDPEHNIRYIEQITERYFSINQAQEVLMYFKENNPQAIQGLNTRALNELQLLCTIRQDIFSTPWAEQALRLQIKDDPYVGKTLDKQHNSIMTQI